MRTTLAILLTLPTLAVAQPSPTALTPKPLTPACQTLITATATTSATLVTWSKDFALRQTTLLARMQNLQDMLKEMTAAAKTNHVSLETFLGPEGTQRIATQNRQFALANQALQAEYDHFTANNPATKALLTCQLPD